MDTGCEMFVAIAEIDAAAQRTRRAVADFHAMTLVLKQKYGEFIFTDGNLDSLKVAKNKMVYISQTLTVLYDEMDNAMSSMQDVSDLFDSAGV